MVMVMIYIFKNFGHNFFLFLIHRTCLLSPEMFPKGAPHKQLFQLMLNLQGLKIVLHL